MNAENEIDLASYLDLVVVSDKYRTYVAKNDSYHGKVGEYLVEVCGDMNAEAARMAKAIEIKRILEAGHYAADALRIAGTSLRWWCCGCLAQQSDKKNRPRHCDGTPIKCRYSKNEQCCLADVVERINDALKRMGHWQIDNERFEATSGRIAKNQHCRTATIFSECDLEAVEKELDGAHCSELFKRTVSKMIADYKKNGGEA